MAVRDPVFVPVAANPDASGRNQPPQYSAARAGGRWPARHYRPRTLERRTTGRQNVETATESTGRPNSHRLAPGAETRDGSRNVPAARTRTGAAAGAAGCPRAPSGPPTVTPGVAEASVRFDAADHAGNRPPGDAGFARSPPGWTPDPIPAGLPFTGSRPVHPRLLPGRDHRVGHHHVDGLRVEGRTRGPFPGAIIGTPAVRTRQETATPAEDAGRLRVEATVSRREHRFVISDRPPVRCRFSRHALRDHIRTISLQLDSAARRRSRAVIQLRS